MLNSSLVHLLLVALLICYKVVFAVDDQYFNACRAGDIAKVKDYLDSGISASSRDAKGNTGKIRWIELISWSLKYFPIYRHHNCSWARTDRSSKIAS